MSLTKDLQFVEFFRSLVGFLGGGVFFGFFFAKYCHCLPSANEEREVTRGSSLKISTKKQ